MMTNIARQAAHEAGARCTTFNGHISLQKYKHPNLLVQERKHKVTILRTLLAVLWMKSQTNPDFLCFCVLSHIKLHKMFNLNLALNEGHSKLYFYSLWAFFYANLLLAQCLSVCGWKAFLIRLAGVYNSCCLSIPQFFTSVTFLLIGIKSLVSQFVSRMFWTFFFLLYYISCLYEIPCWTCIMSQFDMSVTGFGLNNTQSQLQPPFHPSVYASVYSVSLDSTLPLSSLGFASIEIP